MTCNKLIAGKARKYRVILEDIKGPKMSTDPYHAVQQEIQSSLQTAGTLRASYLRIRSTAREDSEELVWARNEVRRRAVA